MRAVGQGRVPRPRVEYMVNVFIHEFCMHFPLILSLFCFLLFDYSYFSFLIYCINFIVFSLSSSFPLSTSPRRKSTCGLCRGCHCQGKGKRCFENRGSKRREHYICILIDLGIEAIIPYNFCNFKRRKEHGKCIR